MADTAAFFAKKKKGGKKAFKSFNANKIDVSQVTSSTHVDAPAVSSEGANLTAAATSNEPKLLNDVQGDEQWDDAALASKLIRPSGGNASSELLDMKALDSKRRQEDDVAERLRLEETRAALAAAREGMEKEALRLKEEKEFKAKAIHDGAIGKPRFGAAAAIASDGSIASSTIKWTPSHLRSVGAAFSSSKLGTGATTPSGFQRQVDTQDENLFPDLATADKMIAKEEEQQQKQRAALAAKKSRQGVAAWGGGATKIIAPQARAGEAPVVITVAEKIAIPPTPPVVVEKVVVQPVALEDSVIVSPVVVVAVEEEPVIPQPEEIEKTNPVPEANNETATPPTPLAASVAAVKKPKKKKKDLSTFKALS